jgi:hypothetical protein
VAASNIVVTLNGSAVPATVTGVNTNWNVSIALPQNQVLTMVISAKDARGLTGTLTESFDTFSQNNYMVEAEDFDFAGGQFIDNPVPATSPQVNSYYYWPEDNSTNSAVPDVDYTATIANGGEAYNYRPLDLAGTDVAADFLRQKYVDNSAIDYYIGWWNPGTWLNYTRTYPAGHFRVWGRLAGGGPYTGLTLSLVTSGQGTSSQATQTLGTFSDATANGWQNWHWVPLVDTNGQPVTITLGGVETLQAMAGSGQNANYYMLVQVAGLPSQPKLSAATGQGKIVIQVPTQNGFNYTVLYNNSLSGGTWQPLGSSFPGTGGTVSVTNSTSVTAQFYKVMAQ